MSSSTSAPTGKLTVTTPGDTQIVMERTFDAPRELVWRFWLDAGHIPNFWGPHGTRTIVDTLELREGGAWRFLNIDAEGTEHAFRGEFRAIEPCERIVWTFEYEGQPGDVVTEEITFIGSGQATTVRSVTDCESRESRDAMLASGMEKGAGETMDRLEQILTRAIGFEVTGVDFVLIPTENLERAMEFYGETLGLERSSVWQRGGTPPIGAEYETGNVTVALIDAAAVGMEFHPQKGALALRVDDVASARAALEAKGVEFFMDDIDSGVCWQAYCKDSEGNALILHHRYAPRR